MNHVVVIFMLVMASAPAHADCASTVNGAIDRLMDAEMKEALGSGSTITPEMRRMAEGMVNEMKPKLKDAMTRSCIDDKWSSDALKCIADATDTTSMERCEPKLSAQQKANLDRAMNAAIGAGSADDSKAACGDAANALADLVLGLRTIPASSSAKAQVKRRREAAASLQAAVAGDCVDDRWSTDVISCMKSASSLTDLATCRGKLSLNAADHLEGAEMVAFTNSVDCVKTERAIERVTKADDSHRTHMMWALAESCSADWWPASALTCVAGAKTTKALERCEAKLAKSQRAHLTAVMTYAMGIGEVIADDPSLPPECKEYHAVIERLASCDKMPAQARDALREAYRQAAAGWNSLPPEAQANLVTACKAGRDAILQSGKSVCGW